MGITTIANAHADGPAPTHVLIVEQQAPIRETLRFMLEDAGYIYPVSEVEDGAAALRFLAATPHPHLVLLAQRLPNLDGAAVIRRAAADPALAHRHTFVFIADLM